MANIVWTEADLKEATDAKASQPTAAVKRWVYAGQIAGGSNVANFLNANPPQVAGEVVLTAGSLGGPFDVFIFI